jgi:hypothetical protein
MGISLDIRGCFRLVSNGASDPAEPDAPDGASGRVGQASTPAVDTLRRTCAANPPSRKISLLPAPLHFSRPWFEFPRSTVSASKCSPQSANARGTLDCRSREVGTVFPDPFDPVFDGGLRDLLLSAEGAPGTVAKSAYLRGIQH